MRYRSAIATAFWAIVALVVGAMISWITDTAWPTCILLVIGIGVGILWLQWPKIADKILSQIKKGIEVSVIQLVIDKRERQLQVSLGLRNKHPAKLTLKAIDHVVVRLNKSSQVATQLETESPKPVRLIRCDLVNVPTMTTIQTSDISFLIDHKKEVAYWDITLTLQFSSDWGDVTKTVSNLEFNQLPRIAGEDATS